MSKKLDDLLKKRKQLNARIQKEKNKQSQQQRKEDTRRKILLGALMMDLMKKVELKIGDRNKYSSHALHKIRPIKGNI